MNLFAIDVQNEFLSAEKANLRYKYTYSQRCKSKIQ